MANRQQTKRKRARQIFGTPLHENSDPAQRVIGVAALPRDSKALAQLLGADPSPDVRIAAPCNCSDAQRLPTRCD